MLSVSITSCGSRIFLTWHRIIRIPGARSTAFSKACLKQTDARCNMRTQCGCTRSTPSCRLKCSKFAVVGEKVRPHHGDPSAAEPQPKLGVSPAKTQRAQSSEIEGENHLYEFLSFPQKLGAFAPWREEF